MKTKRWFSILVVVAMVLAMSTTAFAAPKASNKIPDTCIPWGTEATNFAADLVAGQNITVGAVYIDATTTANTFIVTYKVNDPHWFLTEIHFEAISAGDEAYIQGPGGLIPGSFACKKSWDISEELTSYTFLYTAGATVTGFAAHAVVVHPEVGHMQPYSFCIVSGTDTDLTLGGDASIAWGPGAPWGSVATNVNNIAECPDTANYIWDAQWVTPTVADIGGMVDFEQTFSIIDTPTSATLKIAADNAFEYNFNGGTPVIENLAPDWRTLAGTDNFDWPTVVIDPNPSGWGQVYTYTDVLDSLQEGSNTLFVTGVNADWNTTSPTVNPAMVIYKLCGTSELYVKDEPCAKETAWGFGEDASGSNWSQTITYVPDTLFHQELTVPASNSTGVASDTLIASKQYRIEVSGTWKFVNWATPAIPDLGYADAGYSYRIPYVLAPNSENAWVSGDDLYSPYVGYL